MRGVSFSDIVSVSYYNFLRNRAIPDIAGRNQPKNATYGLTNDIYMGQITWSQMAF